jgi:dihydrofolate reductase
MKRIPQVCLVFAVDENNVFGKNNDIPWRSPQDFRNFKATTLNGNIGMGRLTWESLPKRPLPDRTNYVITSDANYEAPGAIVVRSLEEYIERCLAEDPNRMIYVIGGKSVLEEAARTYADHAVISRVAVKTEVDATCVMGPELPPHRVIEWQQLFEGDDKHPAVRVETVRFLDEAEA